jgi:hypothetical protein
VKAEPILRGLAVAGAAMVLAFVFFDKETPSAPPHAEAASNPAPTALPLKRSEATRPLRLPDPAHVDVLDAYAAARAAALEIQPGAELFGISSHGFLHGTLDLTKTSPDGGPGASLLVQFEHTGQDTSGPAGTAAAKNVAKRHVDVWVERDGLHLTIIEGEAFARKSGARPLGTLAEPTCSSRKAWATAVESGVPEDAEATFLLVGDDLLPVWSLRVPGQPGLHREIDARTCALVTRARTERPSGG